MIVIRTLLSVMFLLAVHAVSAQESWSLQRCLQYAQENNLSVKQADVNLKIAEVDLRASQMQRLPDLNFNTNYGVNWGRTVDPSTNDFINQRISFQSLRLDAGLPLYSGNSINAGVKRSQANLLAAKSDLLSQQVQQLNSVSETYLLAVMAKEQLQAALKTREITQAQLTRTQQLIDAGNLADNERYNIEAQIARDMQTIVAAENSLQAQLLALKTLINLPPDEVIVLEMPDIELPEDEALAAFKFAALYETGYKRAPQVQAALARAEGAKYDITTARAAMLPTLSLFAGLNSNYSTAGRELTGFETITVPQPISFMGQQATIEFEQTIPTFTEAAYTDQLEENFGQSLGINLRVPIFNQFQVSANVQRAKLRQISSQLQYEQAKQTFGSQVQQALAEAQAGQARYKAAKLAYDAQQLAYSNTLKRFELGASNSIDLTTAKINLERSELDLIQAKYNYLYTFKTLEWITTDLSEPVQFF